MGKLIFLNRSSFKAVTLIEVIIAVIIFGIGIVTILIMIVQNISLIDKIRNKSTATLLAKEAMEIVYNLRDTNLKKGMFWNCTTISHNTTNDTYDCQEKFGINGYYQVTSNITGFYKFTSSDNKYKNNILYYHTGLIKQPNGTEIITGFWYNHDTTKGSPTIFSRYVLFTGLYLAPENQNNNGDIVMKIESHVEYRKGKYTGEVVLEGIIGNR